MISTVFFGTHTFATTILQALIDDENISVDLVVTQPDKPVGRSRQPMAPPVKVLAKKHNLNVVQPSTLRDSKFEILDSDIGVTAQYGLLIPKSVLEMPKHGILNVHTSLLPKYRGASPIQSALMNGETETGVTIMKMDVGLDTGPILLQQSTQIDPDETYLELDARLADIGAKALLEAIPQYVDGSLEPTPQDDSQATSCSQFSREDGRVDWNQSTNTLFNQYRGLTPWPGIWTMWNDKRLKLLRVSPSDHVVSPGNVAVNDGILHIGCADGSLIIHELQLEGKKAMDATTFLNGFQSFVGSDLQ